MNLSTSVAYWTSLEERTAGQDVSPAGTRDEQGREPITFPASGSFCVQRFSGSIDIDSAPDFASALDRIAHRSADGIVLELSAVDFFGTAGLALLKDFAEKVSARDVPVAVVGGRTIARPIEVCGLDSLVSVHTSMRDLGVSPATR